MNAGDPQEMSQDIVSELKQIIAQNLDVNLTVDQIDETQPMLEEGLALDSIVLVELINHIENRYDIEFSDSDLRVATFKNLTTLADVVRSKIGNSTD